MVLSGFFDGGAIDSQEMVHQQRQVAIAIAQGRNRNRHHVDAVIEVFAESALAHQILEILVGGADQAEIDFLARSGRPGAARYAPAERAEACSANLGFKRGDLVEEQRAVLRGFDQSGARRCPPR